MFINDPKQWIARHGANLAGGFWNAGDGVQALVGLVVFSPRILLAAVLNVMASSSALLFGHKDWGIVAASSLGIAAAFVFLFPTLALWDFGTWLGFIVFTVASLFGAFSPYLSKTFHPRRHPFLHKTFGRPRRTMGVISFLSRFPIMASAVVHGEWKIFAPYVLWTLGDLAFSLSWEEVARWRQDRSEWDARLNL